MKTDISGIIESYFTQRRVACTEQVYEGVFQSPQLVSESVL